MTAKVRRRVSPGSGDTALVAAIALGLAFVALTAGCPANPPAGGNPNPSTSPAPTSSPTSAAPGTSFVAQLADFKDYQTWKAADYTIGGINPSIGSAHKGDDNAYSRSVYGNGKEAVNGVYPVGAILVKETFTWNGDKKQFAAMGGLFAMVKRGGGFNPSGGGWEWFDLATDSSAIVGRGGLEMMGGMCNGCHSMATASAGADFVFTHPIDYAANDATFKDYSTWTLIDDRSATSSLLGSAHGGDDPTAQRKIYRRPLLGNPDAKLHGYPVGTAIVKEVSQGGKVTSVTAMVKRGWSFNPDHDGWEWFTLDPTAHGVMGRGADLMGGMCNSCHSQAEKPENGVDYVFKHRDDPFNK